MKNDFELRYYHIIFLAFGIFQLLYRSPKGSDLYYAFSLIDSMLFLFVIFKDNKNNISSWKIFIIIILFVNILMSAKNILI